MKFAGFEYKMCIPTTTTQLLNWLSTQERILSVWREEILSTRHTDFALIDRFEYHLERLDFHRGWLVSELEQLSEPGRSETR